MRRLLGLTLLLAAAAPAPAAGPVDDLLGWVPPRANVALMVDVEALYRTDVATANRWGQPDVPTTGLDSLPANAARLVVASQFGPGAGPSWQVSVMAQKKAVSEADFVLRSDGTKETLAGRTVFLTPRHGYVAALAPRVVGGYQPANRPEAGRWLREATGKVPAGLSPYLREASERVGVLDQIVLAVDTADMFEFGQVKARLGKAESLKATKAAGVDIGGLSALFTGLKGVTLKIRASDKLAGEIRLDFAKPAAPLAAVGKPLLLEALDRMGLPADEMAGWQFAVRGEAVTFSGPLSPDAADQLLAPLLGPGTAAADPADAAAAATGPDAKAKASLKYFKAVEKISNDTRSARSENYTHLAYRFNNAAKRIDDLPMLNVDDELLDYGGAMATTFRSMGIVAQSTSGAINTAEANRAMSMVTTPNYYYGSVYAGGVGYWGAYGGGYGFAVPTGATSTNVVSNYGQVNNLNAMTKGKEADYRLKTWDTIKTATTDVRRKMVKKYGIEF